MRKLARKVIVAVSGTAVLLAGVIMLFTPGPGWGGIFAGLAILATEFAWAKRLLHTLRQHAENGIDKLGLRAIYDRIRERIREWRGRKRGADQSDQ